MYRVFSWPIDFVSIGLFIIDLLNDLTLLMFFCSELFADVPLSLRMAESLWMGPIRLARGCRICETIS